jgi:hypothetical protein
MKGDENLAEVQLSCSFFDARTVGRVADRLNGKSEAFDRAGGLSRPPSRYATNFSGFAVSMQEDTKPEKCVLQVEPRSTGQAEERPRKFETSCSTPNPTPSRSRLCNTDAR